jgi:two-component system sensor kinase FixL
MIKQEETERETTSINDVLRDIISLFHSEAIIRNIAVEMDLADPSPVVNVERVQIQQVLINLIINAAEAMSQHGPEGKKIVLQTRLIDHRVVQVAVRDFGPGIDEKDLDYIFDPFFTTKRSGLGMGLSISRSIIEAHGGRIWVENNPDKGVTFYFEIPVT